MWSSAPNDIPGTTATFQINTPMTKRTVQNNKLFNVEFTHNLQALPGQTLLDLSKGQD